ncbi:acyl-CoA synthetase [Acidithiobacillus ferrivorans]|nr:acyl-CoA synthetase [Acidithiobacillus ferrivorans]
MLRLMIWISKKMGRTVGRVVLYLIAGYFLLFAPAARVASRVYLTRVLGRRADARDIYRHFLTFATTIHDRVYLLSNDDSSFTIQSHLSKDVEQAIADMRGALLVGAHLGSFEVLRSVGLKYPGVPVVMVMYEDNAKKLNATLASMKTGERPNIIPLGRWDTMLRVQEQLEMGALVGFLGDRSVGSEKKRIVPFLGEPAAWPSGTFRIAALLNRPLYFMAGLYTGTGHYEIFIKQIADFSSVEKLDQDKAIQDAMLTYVNEIENCCHMAPYNWFNFYDFWVKTSNI